MKIKNALWSTMVLASGSLLIVGCNQSTQKPEKKKKTGKNQLPNILWISTEDISPALGCYGDSLARTPNIDKFAESGSIYTNAYATAPISAPARSCLITGEYATSLGTQHLRSKIPVPQDLKILPEYLREKGYFCTNNVKTDYNFDAHGRWDVLSDTAHWRNRPDGKPFFSVFNFGITHEGHANNFVEPALDTLSGRRLPENIVLPPYYPDTEEMRKAVAQQYDLITLFDKKFGEMMHQLEEDGLADNTIVFLFADHGFGLPRYKRWLYKTGLHVPLIIRIPEKYKQFATTQSNQKEDRLVSFVDFTPTVLQLAGIDQPETMPGKPFLGTNIQKRKYIYGARSRADDVYDVSRCISDGKYIFIRNFMPHQPYIIKAQIFNDEKRTFKELNRLHQAGELTGYAKRMYEPKPYMELYDLENDPDELNNLADSAAYKEVVNKLQEKLYTWILKHHDTGFLHEAEMMIRAEESSPYEMAQSDDYHLKAILDAANMVGNDTVSTKTIKEKLQDDDSGVRFWAATAVLARNKIQKEMEPLLKETLQDSSPSVQIVAAEILCKNNKSKEAMDVLIKHIQDSQRPWVALQAARSLANLDKKAEPAIPVVKKVIKKHSGKIWNKYKNWFYSMFIGFALDQTLINCGQSRF